MLMAAFGEIRGNLPALEAVLSAVDEQGIETIVNTGNTSSPHAWPTEVIRLVRERDIYTVQGEDDRRVARILRKADTLRKKCSPEEFAALEWTYNHTASESVEYLADLPRSRTFTVEGLSIFLCHGTPARQSDALHEADDLETFRRQREIANADIIVCGHGTQPFCRLVDGALFVNSGAAGIAPDDGPGPHYALIDTETEPWSVTFHRVACDWALVQEQARREGGPGN